MYPSIFAEPSEMAKLEVRDAEHQREEEQRHDQHEEEPDEELSDRLRDIADHRVEP